MNTDKYYNFQSGSNNWDAEFISVTWLWISGTQILVTQGQIIVSTTRIWDS